MVLVVYLRWRVFGPPQIILFDGAYSFYCHSAWVAIMALADFQQQRPGWSSGMIRASGNSGYAVTQMCEVPGSNPGSGPQALFFSFTSYMLPQPPEIGVSFLS